MYEHSPHSPHPNPLPEGEGRRSKIGVVYFAGGTGGTAYERALVDCLKAEIPLEEFPVSASTNGGRWLSMPRATAKLFQSVKRASASCQVVINGVDAALMPQSNSRKSLIIVHHLDFSTNRHARIYQLLEGRLYRSLKNATRIVAVSQFWKQWLAERGLTNVDLVYNPFKVEDFAFTDEEVAEFKRTHGLLSKPIVYLGNRGPGKGVEEAFTSLSGMDAHLVASGATSRPDDPLLSFDLPPRGYQLLLKASTVAVTMSTFHEGWCRSSHEAMLCGTPVVGSGRGGMGELLRSGGQIICEDFAVLKKQLFQLLQDETRRRAMGEQGYAFASQFTVQRFKSAWLELLKRVMQSATQ